MTFEEFFNKKRIDLGLMRDADPALYSEFKSHFEMMGEKSFDHTKKFWFNKLRHLYHLAEPVKKTVTQLETQIASQAEPLSSPTIEQGSPATPPASQQEAKSPGLPKPGFRPRSIPAAAAKPVDEPTPAEPDATAEKPAVPVSKPGFKPRNVKPVSGELSEDAQNTASRPGQDIPSGASQGNAANTPRPAYKPRFNAGKISDKAEENTEDKKEVNEATSPPTQETDSVDASLAKAEQPKPAYKPRFNVKNVASKATSSENQGPAEDPTSSGDQNAASTSPVPDNILEEGNIVIPPAASSAPKPAYKPRFNIKAIAQKNLEEADSAGNESSKSTGDTSDTPLAVSAPEEPPVVPEAASPVEPAISLEDGVKSPEKGTEESPKPSYKPRFNIKNIKPKE